MMELLDTYKKLTELQKQYLQQGNVDEALQLMEEKQGIIDSLENGRKQGILHGAGGNEAAQQDFVWELVALNEEVATLMNQQRVRIASELQKLQQGRQVQDAYQGSYTPGAYFFDRKR